MDVLAIYGLLAIAIPFVVEWLKKYDYIPSRFLPFIPPIIGFVTVLLTELSTGTAFFTALTLALGIGSVGIGGASTMGRQIFVKGIKKPKDGGN